MKFRYLLLPVLILMTAGTASADPDLNDPLCFYKNDAAVQDALLQRKIIAQEAPRLPGLVDVVKQKQKVYDLIQSRLNDKRAIVQNTKGFYSRIQILVDGLNELVSQLSGDERSRAELARQLAATPEAEVESLIPQWNLPANVKAALVRLLSGFRDLAQDHTQLAVESSHLALVALSSPDPAQEQRYLATARQALVDVLSGTYHEQQDEQNQTNAVQNEFDKAAGELNQAAKDLNDLRTDLENRRQALQNDYRNLGPETCEGL